MMNNGDGVLRTSARPIETVVDANGDYWICDKGVDITGDLRAQGCVKIDELPLKPED